MTRLVALQKHLVEHGCIVVREGGRHTVWRNPRSGARSTVPRHREIPRTTARSICRQLDVPLLE